MNNKSGRRWGLTGLRLIVCAGAIVWLVYNVPWHDYVRLGTADGPRVRVIEQHDDRLVVERNGHPETITLDEVHHSTVGGQSVPDIELGIPNVVWRVDGWLALLAIVIFGPVWFIQSYRLVLMVAIQGVRLSYWKAVTLTFAGNFFNFALPGTTGGDLVKAYYITRYTHLKTEVVTTVFLDRAIGLFSVVLIAAAAICLRWNAEEFGYLVVTLAVIFGGLLMGAVLIFSRRLRHWLRLPKLAEHLPMGQHLLRIGRATVALRQHKLRVIVSLLLSVVLQAIVMVSAAIMARALDMRGEMSYYFIYVSIGFLIAAIPISPPQAIGVMEAAYVQFFTQSGLATASQAVALALAVRLIQLVWALPGALVPVFGAHLPSKGELAALEGQTSGGADGVGQGPEAAWQASATAADVAAPYAVETGPTHGGGAAHAVEGRPPADSLR